MISQANGSWIALSWSMTLLVLASPWARGEETASAPAAAAASAAKAADERVLLFPIVKGGKWGFMDEGGKVVIQPQYDGAWDFSEGLACVGVGLNRGYIDRTGAMVIKPRFGWAGPFRCGMAAVFGHGDGKSIGGRAGDIYGADVQMYKPQASMLYVDKSGKTVAGGTSPFPFSDGFACGGRGLCIDTTGKAQTHDASEILRFSEGLAGAKKGAKWGFLDHSMKWAIEPQFDMAGAFSEDLGLVADFFPDKKLRWGYVDKSGKVAIACAFLDADEFSEGLAPVQPALDTKDLGGGSAGLAGAALGKSWGYIEKGGQVVIQPKFDYAWRFSEGLGRVLLGEKHGYIDKQGKIVIEPKFDAAWEFSRGLARVCVGQKEGYIDPNGKFVWEPTE